MSVQTERTTVRRAAARGSYDRDTIDQILDEAYVCHVGVVHDGTPIVIPTLHVRDGNHLLIHGSPASAMLRQAPKREICVTVTLVDGFVLARSAFHHSINYRSVVVIGTPEIVPAEDKEAALDLIVDQLVPGRRASLRPMTEKEVKGTTVLRLPITEASAKCRSGMPIDDEADYDLPIWAGVVPVATTYGEPLTDPAMRMDVDVPEHARHFAPKR